VQRFAFTTTTQVTGDTLAAIKLCNRPLDLPGNLALFSREQLLEAQQFQSTLDHLLGILVRADLNGTRDCLILLRTSGRHIVCRHN
jgi:hypothetical protein